MNDNDFDKEFKNVSKMARRAFVAVFLIQSAIILTTLSFIGVVGYLLVKNFG